VYSEWTGPSGLKQGTRLFAIAVYIEKGTVVGGATREVTSTLSSSTARSPTETISGGTHRVVAQRVVGQDTHQQKQQETLWPDLMPSSPFPPSCNPFLHLLHSHSASPLFSHV
jgi:hypothetical protein